MIKGGKGSRDQRDQRINRKRDVKSKCLPVRQAGKMTNACPSGRRVKVISEGHAKLRGAFDLNILRFAFFLAAFIFLTSCHNEKILYSKSEEIGKDGWAFNDPITFSFTAEDTTQAYDLNLEITHDKNYSWQNLYVEIETKFPGDSLKTDVLSLELSDGIGGWEGRCQGKTCRILIPLRRHFRFPLPGEYGLTFVQDMRQDLVPGIHGLGLTVVRAEM